MAKRNIWIMGKEQQILGEFYDQKSFTNTSKSAFAEKVKRIEEIKYFSFQQTDEERRLYKKFCDIANNDPDQKFKFEHIEKLKTGADVVIIYGKKGIGKTYQISKIIKELAEKDAFAEVILLRNTVAEFRAVEKQLSVDYCPIFMKGKGNNPTLFHKEFLRGGKPRYMGFCGALNGFSLEAAKGAEYPNIRLIIWDECTNMGTGNAGFDSADVNRFITFFDSIIRNKTNVKIYIFGNFHRGTDGNVSDVLLDTLNIPYDCTLKLRDSTSQDKTNTSKLLFINTGSLYKGIDSNSKIGLFGSKVVQDDLFSNMPRSYSNMIGGLNLFYSHTPEFGYLFNEGEHTYLLLISSFTRQKDSKTKEVNYMIHMEELPTNNDFVHDIVTASVALFNEYNGQGVTIISAQEERLIIHDLFEICLQQSLYYSCDVTRELFKLQMDKWQDEYELGISVAFFPRKRRRYEGF